MSVLTLTGLLLTGLLAGGEFMVRYGIHPALAALDDRAHLQARQALIGRLRVIVPILMLPTLAAGIATLVVNSADPGGELRWAGTISLACFALTSFLGTVPINIRVFDWNADAPPADWKRVIGQWVTLDTFRSSFALLAFAFSLASTLNP